MLVSQMQKYNKYALGSQEITHFIAPVTYVY